MSLGYGGMARFMAKDASSVLYEYGSYNWNLPRCSNKNGICDGSITIQKDCFIEPEIHKTIKKMPSGRKKLIVKRIPRDAAFDTYLTDGKIKVENSRFCWTTIPGPGHKEIDRMIFPLLFEIFREYQITGTIPKKIAVYY